MIEDRRLDALVAEKIFGTEVEFLNQQHGYRIDYRASDNTHNDPIYSMDIMVDGYRLKSFSSSIEAAWAVAEHVQKLKPHLAFYVFGQVIGFKPKFHDWGNEAEFLNFDETHPAKKICLAALLALGLSVE